MKVPALHHLRLAALALAGCFGGCVTTSTETVPTLQSEKQILDLIKHPRKWDGRTFRVRIYPYDNGLRQSSVVCFEACDRDHADRSPFLIYTATDRFLGYVGDQPILVLVSYSSTCFYRHEISCPEGRSGLLTEIDSSRTE